MRVFFLLVLLLFSISIFSYNAGELSFTYLNIPVSPISSALSYSCAAQKGGNTDIYNPASIYGNNNEIYFSYTNYIANTHLGYIEYSMKSYKFSIKYFNSGIMEKRDTLNNYLGDFMANMILFNAGSYYDFNENLHIGYAILLGAENADDYSQYAAGISMGAIYKIRNNFNIGFYMSNLGASYNQDSDITILPSRIITGISYNNKKIRLMSDAGKILDSDYFLSMGFELYLIGENDNYINEDNTNNENLIENTIIEKNNSIIETNNTNKTIIDTLQSDSIEESINNTSIIDSMNNPIKDTLKNIENDSLKESIKDTVQENSYMSYADYLEQMEKQESKDTIVSDTIKNEKTTKQEDIVKENITKKENNIKFVFRMGVSTDRKEFESGTTTDLIAGFTGGFGLYYKQYRIDYSAKFLGQLGIGHSIGIKVNY